jgi:hypothetical protein
MNYRIFEVGLYTGVVQYAIVYADAYFLTSPVGFIQYSRSLLSVGSGEILLSTLTLLL